MLSGDVRAAARLMRRIDDDPHSTQPVLARLYPHTGRAQLVGVTGNPGAGKSTLLSSLLGGYRSRDVKVGVVAVDPSSPFSGGAILGDRIRMMEHAADPGVFIRSVASRGALGGVSRSTQDIAHVMEAMGCGVVLIETLGVGQAEVDIVQMAQTVVVVLTPGYGDDVQALKAGLLEIADVFVVNKADRQGADTLVRQLRSLWELASDRSAGDEAWRPPVLKTVATTGQGIGDLEKAIAEHQTYLEGNPAGRHRERQRVERMLLRLVEDHLTREIAARFLADDRRDELIDGLVTRERDPYSTAAELVERMLE